MCVCSSGSTGWEDSWDNGEVREIGRVRFNHDDRGLALRTHRGWFVPNLLVGGGSVVVENAPILFAASPGGRSWLRMDLLVSVVMDTGTRRQGDNTRTTTSRFSLFCAFDLDRTPACLHSPPTEATLPTTTVTTPGDGTVVIDSMQAATSVFVLPP